MVLDNVASLKYFAPELVLSAGVLVLLFVDLVTKGPSRRRASAITIVTLAGALVATVVTMGGDPRGLFGGLIARDPFTDFFKLLFIATTAFVGVAVTRSRETIDYQEGPDKDRESAELYALALTTTIGMNLMAASTNLLMAFLSLEMVSIMSYILAGFKRRDRKSSEAALKYVIYGSVASGVMIYGMSLLYGFAGSLDLGAIRAAATAAGSSGSFMLITAVVLSLAGFGYKIAVVPFHMWCPDVYEGAPTPITAFFSVGPKAAGFALLIRFFSGAVPDQLRGEVLNQAPWPLMLAVVSAATMTLGNLAAIMQSNVKRMLAYSSIAHAGYLLMGLCTRSPEGQQAILLYLVTYLFMNLGAFLVVLGLAEAGVGEDLSAWRGIGFRAKLPALVMAVSLFSLTGLPPFAGFFGKFYLFAALVKKGGSLLVALALIGILNSAVSLYYYARVLKAMYFEKGETEEPVKVAPIHLGNIALMGAITAGLWLVWEPLVQAVQGALVQWYPQAATAVAAAVQ